MKGVKKVLYVDDNGSIQLTRGDTARLSVVVNNELTGSSYDIQETDTLTLTIKKNVNESTPLVQKVIRGSNQFYIEPTDTRHLQFGKYVYDVELRTDSGDVYTIIVPSLFEILKEVTY